MGWSCEADDEQMSEKEFAQYLKAEVGFQRFVAAWIHQYQRLGHFGGNICLHHLSETEQDAIGSLLGMDLHNQTTFRISYQKLQKCLQSTRFEYADFYQVLEAFHETIILTKHDQKQKEEEAFERECTHIQQQYGERKVWSWIQYDLKHKGSLYQRIRQCVKEDQMNRIYQVFQMYEELPCWKQEHISLPIFANTMLHDPHGLDQGFAIQLLYQGICYLLQVEDHGSFIERNENLYQAGLLRDELSNYVMIAHLDASYQGQLHTSWHNFYMNWEPWVVTLHNMSNIDCVESVTIVYIVENPSVFMELCQVAKAKQLQYIGFICTNGQPNACAYVLLDLLKKRNVKMYYSGDYDPEGLHIAQKLKDRYKDQLQLWRYCIEDYHKAMSHKTASQRRLTMMDGLHDVALCTIANEIRKHQGSCGYQEALVQAYCIDIMLSKK